MLERRNIDPNEVKIINQLLDFCGLKRNRTPNQTTDILTTENVKAFTKKVIKGFKGVENIYTQHKPMIKEIIEDMVRGRLKETQFPFLGTVQQRERPNEIIIFMIGGITYEESLTVYNLNQQLNGIKIIIGGSMIHNSKTFLDEVRIASQSVSESIEIDKQTDKFSGIKIENL